MPFELNTPKRLAPILQDLSQREPIFHHADHGAQRAVFEQMTEPDFWEVGASGRRYSREEVVRTLVERYSRPHVDNWRADDFNCQEIAPDNYLVTYRLIQDDQRVTRRSTLWRRTADGWKVVFHQGTVVQNPDDFG